MIDLKAIQRHGKTWSMAASYYEEACSGMMLSGYYNMGCNYLHMRGLYQAKEVYVQTFRPAGETHEPCWLVDDHGRCMSRESHEIRFMAFRALAHPDEGRILVVGKLVADNLKLYFMNNRLPRWRPDHEVSEVYR